MTTPNPTELRELADKLWNFTNDFTDTMHASKYLRAFADRLEAVVDDETVERALRAVEKYWTQPATLWSDTARESIRAALMAALPLGDADRRDAERYRWLRNHPCNQLYVTYNGNHACNYMTATDWIDEHPEDYAECDTSEIQKMKDTNTIWCVHIYPNTPVGFNWYHAATLDSAIDRAIAGEKSGV